MLRPNPEERPSTTQLLALPLVRKHLALFAEAFPSRAPVNLPGAAPAPAPEVRVESSECALCRTAKAPSMGVMAVRTEGHEKGEETV